MLLALAHPLSLGVLLLSFVGGVTLRGWVQCRLADLMGDRRPRLEGRLKADPRVHLDPFGAVGALLGGIGWGRVLPAERLRGRPARVAVRLAGPAVNVALGVGALLAVRLGYGATHDLSSGAASVLQHGAPLRSVPAVLLLVGASQLYLGVLALVPLPPLDGGRLLFGLAPRTHGWLNAEHQLDERNIGVVVLLVLLLIPVGGPVPVLPQLLDGLLSPLLALVLGG